MILLTVLMLVAIGVTWATMTIFWQDSVQRYKKENTKQTESWKSVREMSRETTLNNALLLIHFYELLTLKTLTDLLAGTASNNYSSYSDIAVRQNAQSPPLTLEISEAINATRAKEDFLRLYDSVNCTANAELSAAAGCSSYASNEEIYNLCWEEFFSVDYQLCKLPMTKIKDSFTTMYLHLASMETRLEIGYAEAMAETNAQVAYIEEENDAANDQNDKELQSSLMATAMIACITFAFVLGISYFLGHYIDEPLQLLMEDMHKVGDLQIASTNNVTAQLLQTCVLEMQNIGISYAYLKAGIQCFAHFVPRGVVQRIVQGDERAAHLYVEPAECTIFFSDIANFTSISEQIGLEKVMHLMESYLTFMSRVIEEEGGVIGDFIGDGIMAFWGSPEPTPHHAALACKTALRIQQELMQLNRKWASEGFPNISTRIGLNSGAVLAGNIGSEEKMKFGVLGDEVNLAACLEDMNKCYGTKVLISDSTFYLVKQLFVCRPLEVVTVKKRPHGAIVYELMESIEAATEEQKKLAKMATRALEHYCNREWHEAFLLCKQMQDYNQGDDKATQCLCELCLQMMHHPPGPDWEPASTVSKRY